MYKEGSGLWLYRKKDTGKVKKLGSFTILSSLFEPSFLGNTSILLKLSVLGPHLKLSLHIAALISEEHYTN
jgi:hypothetical protein